KNHTATGKPARNFRSDQGFTRVLSFANFRQRHQPQWENFTAFANPEVVARDVKFLALRINHDTRLAGESVRLRRRRDAFHTAEAEQFHTAGQLPTLRQRDGYADAGVRSRAESDHQALYLFTFEASLFERLLDHVQRFHRMTGCGLDDFTRRGRVVFRHGHASLG